MKRTGLLISTRAIHNRTEYTCNTKLIEEQILSFLCILPELDKFTSTLKNGSPVH